MPEMQVEWDVEVRLRVKINHELLHKMRMLTFIYSLFYGLPKY
jgi:hypothetical protein